MIVTARTTSGWSSIRASSPRRRLAHPILLAVEHLEPRFLLAGVTLDPIEAAPEQLPWSGQVGSPILTTAAPRAPMLTPVPTDQSTLPVLTGRVDSFVLEAGQGVPEVQVELRWSGGTTPADGELVLLDASGATVFESSLVGVREFQTSILFSTGQAGAATTASLAIDLAIQRGTDDPTNPGSYRLTLAWKPTPTATTPTSSGVTGITSSFAFGVMVPPPPQPGAVPTPSPTGAVSSPSLPGLTISGFLPASIASASVPETAADPGASIPSPFGNTIVAGGFAAIVPANVAPGVVASGLPGTVIASPSITTPTPSTSPSGGHASPGQAGITPAPAASDLSDRGLPTFVGPLPLGASTPDGGIFARPFATAASIRIGGAIDRQAMAAMLVPGIRPVPTGIGGGTWTISDSPGWERVPLVGAPAAPDCPSRSMPARPENGVASDPTSVGAAFLPPIASFSGVRTRGDSARPVEIRRPRPRGVPGNPVAAVLVALTSSAAMVLTLDGPQRVMALRTARRSKRRAV